MECFCDLFYKLKIPFYNLVIDYVTLLNYNHQTLQNFLGAVVVNPSPTSIYCKAKTIAFLGFFRVIAAFIKIVVGLV